MKKTIVISIICMIAYANVFSQNTQGIHGQYRFSQVKITASDFRSKNTVFTKVFTDSLQAMTQNWDFPQPPVFSRVFITNGQIVECTLLNDGQNYVVVADNLLKKMGSQNNETENQEEGFPAEYYLSRYSITEQGNSITVTFDKVIYGSSNYPNQTLEGVCEIKLVKQ